MARDTKHGRCSVQLETHEVTADAGWLLVDISDTSNWPHTLATGHVEVESLHIEIDPDTSFRGDVEIGFLDTVRGNVSDMHSIFCWQFDTGGQRIFESLYFYEHPIACDTRFHYGQLTTDTAIFGSDKGLSGPPGGASTFYAGAGDLVLFVNRTAGTVTVSVTVGYNIVQDTN